MEKLKKQVADLLMENPDLLTLELAAALKQPEGLVILALPSPFIRVVDGVEAEALLGKLSEWGELVTIIEKEGSIFEVSGPFPGGKNGYGYFNLNMKSDSNSALHGHLKLEAIKKIVLLNKPFRGKESYAFVFIAASDNVIFKVYLGRDRQRTLYPQQVEQFKHLFIQQ
ncbi:heme utilization cystosolic carrier protein HutX [Testudinibacter sp. TR-2022]|uniref:heme utilization cystosolic carrier protein HutX n=1 Tax=Testudinibacter sp. TR-2022 TaxID=2585029 RepID=UPI001118131B|nr:heme utilization cystosolic carrier protein HutX [Testudinibacter sp. TR-2022]TNH09711.1 heme utilization cystosolic carrier protein HutX [Pasteurellaceae bacterium Phil11]TNH23365.1 heme utilization cystosolic carrier protein HutX [Testudinibacter sp. TR-2022]TNH26809.1 heme utilization cystosolic carrier protein HutX [Testudinibacter sp. TR-2022]